MAYGAKLETAFSSLAIGSWTRSSLPSQLRFATTFVREWSDEAQRFTLSVQQRTQIAAGSLRNVETSGSLAIIELEHPAETLSANDLTLGLANIIDGIEKFVVEPLVISFGVTIHELL